MIDASSKQHFVYQCIAILRILLASQRSEFLRVQLAKLMTHNETR